MLLRYADHSTAQLAQLVEDNANEFMRALAQDSAGELVTTPELTRFSNTAILSPMFNGVVQTRLTPERVEVAILETEEYFRGRGRPVAFWWVGPSTRPTDLDAHLMRRGWQLYDLHAPSMAVDLHRLPPAVETPPGFTIEIVRDSAGAQAWAEAFNLIYNAPAFAGQAWADAFNRFGVDQAPFRLYLGRLGRRVVATNMLVGAGGVAGVFGVGVTPEARGQGVGKAITVRPYLDARDEGYHIGVLFSTEMGHPIYRRLGFEDVGTISRYLWRTG